MMTIIRPYTVSNGVSSNLTAFVSIHDVGWDTWWGSGGFRCRYLVRFRRVPLQIPVAVLEGSGADDRAVKNWNKAEAFKLLGIAPEFISLLMDVYLFVVVGTSTQTQRWSGEAKRHPPIQVPMWETTLGTDGFVSVPVWGTDGEETVTTMITQTRTRTASSKERSFRRVFESTEVPNPWRKMTQSCRMRWPIIVLLEWHGAKPRTPHFW